MAEQKNVVQMERNYISPKIVLLYNKKEKFLYEKKNLILFTETENMIQRKKEEEGGELMITILYLALIFLAKHYYPHWLQMRFLAAL